LNINHRVNISWRVSVLTNRNCNELRMGEQNLPQVFRSFGIKRAISTLRTGLVILGGMKGKQSVLNERALAGLADHLAAIDSPETISTLFEELLTPSERRDLALRWRLMEQLVQGVPQRRIAANLGVSLCKITRGSSVLKQPGSVCRKLLGVPENENRPDQN